MKAIIHQIGKDPLYNIWHTSDSHLLMYFHSDGGSVVCSEGNFPIKEGALVFIAADTYHYTLPDAPEKYDRSKIFATKSEQLKISELLNLISSDKAIVYAEIEEAKRERVNALFDEIEGCTVDSERKAVTLCSYLKLLSYLDKYSKASTQTAVGFMARAVNYINENIALDIDIDDVCSAVNVSKYHFCRQFKKQMGMTMMQYVLKTRIVLAKNDLKSSNLSVTEISEKNGFSSVSYFSRVFKEEEKCSPLKYRKMNKA